MSKNFFLRQFLKAGGSFFASTSIAIGSLCPIVLNSSRALADSFQLGIPTEAANELQSLASQNINPKAIAFAPNGGWVILNGTNGYNVKDVPQKVLDTLEMLHDQNLGKNLINSVTFTPTGEWIIVFNNYGVYTSDNFPKAIINELINLHKQKSIIRSIAFAPNGAWAIIYNDNAALFSRKFPKEAHDKLAAINKQKATINTIAFNHNGGFVIIYNTTQYSVSQNNVPSNLTNVIEQYHKSPYRLVNIAFTPTNSWALLFKKMDRTNFLNDRTINRAIDIIIRTNTILRAF